MAKQFASTHEPPAANPEEGAGGGGGNQDSTASDLAAAGMANFVFEDGGKGGGAAATSTPPANPDDEAAAAAAAAAAAEAEAAAAAEAAGKGGAGGAGEKGGADDTPNYQEAYVNWAKGKGIEYEEGKAPEIKNAEDMERNVANYYIEKYSTDPFMVELQKRGLTLDQYTKELQPYQQMMGMPARDLYIQNKISKEMEEQVKLGNFKEEDAWKTEYKRRADALKEEIKSTPDDMLENAVKPLRDAYQQKINEIPDKLRQDHQDAVAKQIADDKAAYDADRDEFLKTINSELTKGTNYGIPFKGQADKGKFEEFVKQQTEFGKFKVKGEDGKEHEVQDVPFLYRIYNDEKTQAQVLRFLYALDNGELTDIKNNARQDALKDLGLEPTIPGARSEKSTSRFAPTHEPSTT